MAKSADFVRAFSAPPDVPAGDDERAVLPLVGGHYVRAGHLPAGCLRRVKQPQLLHPGGHRLILRLLRLLPQGLELELLPRGGAGRGLLARLLLAALAGLGGLHHGLHHGLHLLGVGRGLGAGGLSLLLVVGGARLGGRLLIAAAAAAVAVAVAVADLVDLGLRGHGCVGVVDCFGDPVQYMMTT